VRGGSFLLTGSLLSMGNRCWCAEKEKGRSLAAFAWRREGKIDATGEFVGCSEEVKELHVERC
jgi:hypothetical protein